MGTPDDLSKAAFAGLPRGDLGRETALLCIDLQRLDADPNGALFEKAHGLRAEAGLEEYRLALLQILPRIARLQEAFRRVSLEVIHARIQSLTGDGRDRSPLHKALGIHAGPGSAGAEFVPGVAPEGDEIVLNKTSASPFTSTPIDYVLRNIGIRHVVVVGVMTSGCVETTVRDAADRGYLVTIASDGCAARTRAMHQKTLEALGGLYAHLTTVDDLISALGERPHR